MMIFDRTSNDVSMALQLVRRGGAFSNEELQIIERGIVTVNTLNRIEDKQRELMYALNDMGYSVVIQCKSWEEGDFFLAEDLERISNNTAILRKAFDALKNTPANPRAEYHYREFNLMERVLNDVQSNIEITKGYYKICGVAECGG